KTPKLLLSLIKMDIPIIYQDDQLMVIDKPPGLVVDSSETQKLGTLQQILETDFKIKVDRGGVVHRLDKDTSGVMLVAKTPKALEQLQFQFKERLVKKQYLVLVHGFVEEPGQVVGAIERNPGDRKKFIVSEKGKEAETRYEPIESLQITDRKMIEIFPN